MTPRKTAVEQSKGVFEVEWPMFGELSRALALKVVRDYDPEVVIGVATAGVVPGAVIAAIMDREFHSIIVSRRYQSESIRDTPSVFCAVPTAVRNVPPEVLDPRGTWPDAAAYDAQAARLAAMFRENFAKFSPTSRSLEAAGPRG